MINLTITQALQKLRAREITATELTRAYLDRIEKFGKELVQKRIQEAKETWAEDPLEIVSWMDGMRIENEIQE